MIPNDVTTTFQYLITNSLSKYRDRVFAKFGGDLITYHDVQLGSNRVANALQKAGFGPGDRIGLILPNSLEQLYAMIGIIKAGTAMLAMTMMAGDNDIVFIINDAKIRLIIIDSSVVDRILSLRPKCPTLERIIVVGANTGSSTEYISFNEFQGNQSDENPILSAKPDDEAAIAYTGGTTGVPKGVIHTQKTFFFGVVAQCVALNFQREDLFLLMTPLTHAAGIFMYSGMIVGCKFIIEKQFDPFKILEIIEREKVKKVFLVPVLIYLMLEMVKQKKYDTSSLDSIFYGASPISPIRLAEAMETFGPIFIQSYGQTESMTVITALLVEDHLKGLKNPQLLQSCGRPGVMVNLKILDDKDNEVQVGQVGEICLQHPYVMSGYLNQPEMTEQVLRNGWLHTGDMGKVDEEGYVYIVDRKKDMIISGAMNVYPAEVENMLIKHPKVKQAAVIGIPDDKWGEAVIAIVVPSEDVSEKDILDFCRGKLAKYAQPKRIVFQQQLPTTPLGKIDKKALRAPYWKSEERGIH